MTNDPLTRLEKDTNATTAFTPGAAGDATLGFALGMHETAMTAPPGYEILNLLGRGGMGVVYRARQLSLNRIVALKTITPGPHTHPSAGARFEQEAQTIARLQHPHIVAAFDFGRHEGRLFLAMEFVEGLNLEDFIGQHGQLDEATTWGLIRQAAAGLAHAASAGIVHRDVKPANMLLVSPPAGFPLPPDLPMLKLTDFGLAFLANDHRDARLTTENTTLGSPHYMAPEQIIGQPVDHRTDIYGLGATAYHMLTGAPPFPGDTIGQVIARKIKGDTPHVHALAPIVSAASCQLVEQLMHAQIESRPKDYAELLSLIDQLHQRGASLHHPAAMPVDDRPGKIAAQSRGLNWKWLVAASALVVCALLAVSLLRTFPRANSTVIPHNLTGWAAPLYDGSTLRGWLPRSGQWTPTEDAEGGNVIQGSGLLHRSLPASDKPLPHRLATYRLAVACDLASAAAAEMQFGFAASPGKPRLVLRMEKDAVRFGRRDSDSAPLMEISRSDRMASQAEAGQPSYQELRAERHANQWVVFANGKPFATSKPLDENELAEVGLAAEGGQAIFDGPQVMELKPPQD